MPLNINLNTQKAAVVAGVSLFIMTFAAIYAYGFVHSHLVISNDAVRTFANIQASKALYFGELLGWLVIITTDLLVTWGFYMYLKPVNQSLALKAGVARLIYTFILAGAVYQLVSVLFMHGSNAEIITLERIEAFETIWFAGLIVFGFHLILVGLTAMQTSQIPKWISILLMIAGVSYMVVHTLYLIVPELDVITKQLEAILRLPMMAGELGFALWLLVAGRNKSLAD